MNFKWKEVMKRISDFADCCIDMKKMAALNGGAATSYSSTQSTASTPDYPCGDTMTFTYGDNDNCGGTGKQCEWFDKMVIKVNDCPGYAVKVLDSSVSTTLVKEAALFA